MNRASTAAVQDFVQTASKSELDNLEHQIAQRRAELASRVPRPEPIQVVRELCK